MVEKFQVCSQMNLEIPWRNIGLCKVLFVQNTKTPATPHPSKDAKVKGKTPEAAKSAAKPQLNFESDEDEDDEEESGEDEEMDEEESGEGE